MMPLCLSVTGQCLAESAALELTLVSSVGGTNNRSGVVFNPNQSRYYSVNAGSSNYPADTYDATGTLLDSVAQGFDYRGAWWNPALQQFEGNGYSESGIFVHDIDPVTGHALGTGTVVLSAAQPDVQSVGDLDTDANEIIYYFNGAIHRYSRATNALLGTLPITGLPVPFSELNNNSVIYTGCVGHEIGVYDFVNRRVLFINKATGAFASQCELPSDAPPRSSFGMSYANGMFWLYANNQWHGYGILQGGVGVNEANSIDVRVFPNPATTSITVAWNTASGASAEVRIMDMSGKVLRSTRTNADLAVLDVSMLAGGAYVVQCISGQDIMTGRFLKD